MKRFIAIAALVAVAAPGCNGSVTEPQPGDVVVLDEGDAETADARRRGLSTCSAVGASINAGVGATDEETGAWTYLTCELFAEFTNQIAFFFNLSVPGATSADILADQARKAAFINLVTRRIDDRLIMAASGGNDLLALLDPVLDEATGIPLFVGADGTIYSPVVDAETGAISFVDTGTGEVVASVVDPASGIPAPAVQGVQVLVNGAPCFTGDPTIFQTQCLPLLGQLFGEYESNLRGTLENVTAFSDGATILFRLEYNAFKEANCLTGAYSIGVDNSDPANAFIPGAQIAALRAPVLPPFDDQGVGTSFVDLLIQGNPVFGVEGLNGVARRVAAEYDVTTFDTYEAFTAEAEAGGDFVTQDCIHPNDDGHAKIAELAFGAWLEANGVSDD